MILRSDYVVYDLDNRKVAIAQANLGQIGSDVEITKGALPTPSGVQSGLIYPYIQCSSAPKPATYKYTTNIYDYYYV